MYNRLEHGAGKATQISFRTEVHVTLWICLLFFPFGNVIGEITRRETQIAMNAESDTIVIIIPRSFSRLPKRLGHRQKLLNISRDQGRSVSGEDG